MTNSLHEKLNIILRYTFYNVIKVKNTFKNDSPQQRLHFSDQKIKII